MEMVKFQDMPYERPDFEAMKEAYRQAAEESEAGRLLRGSQENLF